MVDSRISNKQSVEIERVRLLYRLALNAMVGLFVSTTAIAGFFWFAVPYVSKGVIGLWFLLAVLLIFFRVLIVLRFNRADLKEFDASFWTRVFIVGASLSGFVLGISPVIFLDPSDSSAVIFLTLVIFMTLSGSLGVLANCRIAYYIYAFLATAPLITLFILQGEGMLFIGLLLIVFVAVQMFYANSLYKSITESIFQRFENVELLDGLKQERRCADKANIDKTRLLAATSHDLRQPLHSLSLFLAVLKERLTTVEQRELMHKTELSQQVLNDQLNAIIEVAQIDSGELKVRLRSVSVKHAIDTIIEEFDLLAAEVNLTIRTRICDAWIDVDPILFARIVRNLISNAICHCPDSTLLIASRLRKGTAIELMLIDTGPGIAENEAKNIFSEFYQLNNPERDRNKGMGLGLSIVKRLSTLLNVPVEFSSRLGHGTFFKLTFSLSLAGSESIMMTEGVAKDDIPSHVSGLFIVIVDDEKENLVAMKHLLMYWQAEVLTATCYKDLLTQFEFCNYPLPDLMLVDYRLKEGETGINLIQKMRQFFKKNVPAAIMTGDVTLSLKEDLLDSGVAVEYKPLSAGRLAGVIGKIAVIED
ncbi:MAG: two-component system, sensor histidine kinase [Thiomicrorhabdus sp.]|nr:MAG: two-component system, sensor histidine kinase [Thiomicrorhabdus sp.]